MVKKLTAAFVKTVTGPGKYGDQHGLILRVLPSGAKQWIWRGTVHGRRRDLGLGGFPYVSLAEARQLAFDYRKLARAGGDPSALRKGRAVPTFEQALEEVLAIHRGSWRDGGKSEQQWRASLRDYAIPQLGRRPVDAITTADVIAVLTPIWNEKRVTAQRVRQRIGAIMRWAIAQGYRGDNPAGEALAAVLPRNNGARAHHRALPHGEVAAALARVRASEAWPATKLAFEFLVLSACRSGEVQGRPLGRDRHRGSDLDSAVLADEGWARAAGTTVYAGAWGAGSGRGGSLMARGWCSPRRAVSGCPIARCRCCCEVWVSTRWRTGSGRASGTGQQNRLIRRTLSWKRRSRTSSVTRRRPPTREATCSRSDAS